MKNTVITNFKELIILNLNYKFQNDIDTISEVFSTSMQGPDKDKIVTNTRETTDIKIAVHKELEELFVEIDMKINEEIDLSEITHDENILPIRLFELSARFYFDIELSEDIKESLKISEDQEKIFTTIRDVISITPVDIAVHQSIDIIKKVSSIDFGTPINISNPKKNYNEILFTPNLST